MAKTKAQHDSQRANELNQLLLRLSVPQIAERIWDDVLTCDERSHVGEEPPRLALTRTFAQLRGCSFERAVIDLSLEVDLLGVGRHLQLRRAIGEPLEEDDAGPRPKWDAGAGQLWYCGEVVRPVSPRAKNLRIILSAFQETRWPPRIDNPLPGGRNSKKLRDALDSFKEQATVIRLSADGAAGGIIWSVDPKRRRRKATTSRLR